MYGLETVCVCQLLNALIHLQIDSCLNKIGPYFFLKVVRDMRQSSANDFQSVFLFFHFFLLFSTDEIHCSLSVGVSHENVSCFFMVVLFSAPVAPPRVQRFLNSKHSFELLTCILSVLPVSAQKSKSLNSAGHPHFTVLVRLLKFSHLMTGQTFAKYYESTTALPCLTTSLENVQFIFKSCHQGDKSISHCR